MINEKRISQYLRISMNSISIDRMSRENLRREMYYDIRNRVFDSGMDDPFKVLGSPNEYAGRFLEERKPLYPKAHSRASVTGHKRSLYGYEYVSKSAIAGLPIVHVNTCPFGVAKGVIAIGNIAVGVLSIGGISFGLLSFGGLAFSILFSAGGVSSSLIFALGGLAFSLYFAAGGLAVSYDLALGGMAIARNYAIGGFSMANVAVGENARGAISIYQQTGVGDYLLKLPKTADQIIDFVTSKKAEISTLFEWIVRIIY
ncbi:MAG: hypothetical protein JW697_01675 [Kosmotogaceae bacterium]|nr:hypothetical protein [Kosmotogaceae bacterium]